MRLWPVAEAKPLRFHDPRHSTATLLLKAGVQIATVQKILRHTDPKITSEVHGHLDLEDRRAGLNRLALGLPPPPELPPFAATLLLRSANPKGEGPDAPRFPEEVQGRTNRVFVIEIPTPRWTAYDAVRFGVKMDPKVPLVTQERAYTSPIWYTPAG